MIAGDFTRGVIASAKGAAESGTEVRGDDEYQIGDLTAGSAKAAGHYVSQNRVRLAGAGGSAAGMIAGAALLGPVGFVAGSMLGSSAAQSSVRALSGDPKKKTDGQEQPLSERNMENNCSGGRGSQNQTLDLLSANPQTQFGALSALSTSARNAASFEVNTETKLIGEIATVDHRTASQYPSCQMENDSYPSGHSAATDYPLSAPASNIPRVRVTASNNRRKDVQGYENRTLRSNLVGSTRSNSLTNTRGANTGHENAARALSNVQPRGSKLLYSQSNTVSYQQNINTSNAPSANPRNQINEGKSGYRFGNITKSIVARGKQVDGRDANSGYKLVSDKRHCLP